MIYSSKKTSCLFVIIPISTHLIWPGNINEENLQFRFLSQVFQIISRGGVEDTRLEDKAKDTIKIRGQGQGQPFRGQTLSRPRTGMLEVKAKDTSASALQKKKNQAI